MFFATAIVAVLGIVILLFSSVLILKSNQANAGHSRTAVFGFGRSDQGCGFEAVGYRLSENGDRTGRRGVNFDGGDWPAHRFWPGAQAKGARARLIRRHPVISVIIRGSAVVPAATPMPQGRWDQPNVPRETIWVARRSTTGLSWSYRTASSSPRSGQRGSYHRDRQPEGWRR